MHKSLNKHILASLWYSAELLEVEFCIVWSMYVLLCTNLSTIFRQFTALPNVSVPVAS